MVGALVMIGATVLVVACVQLEEIWQMWQMWELQWCRFVVGSVVWPSERYCNWLGTTYLDGMDVVCTLILLLLLLVV